jgi:hypothetical protein
LNPLGTDHWGRRLADHFLRGLEQGVPGQIHGALHYLRPNLRQAARSLDDGTYQAGLNDGMARHLLGVVRIHGPDLTGVVAVCEPPVLQPAHAYEISGLVEDAGDVVELGESRARLVAEPELAHLSTPGPPADLDFGYIGARSLGRRDDSGCHWLLPT